MVTRKHNCYRAYDGLGVLSGNQPLETSWVWRRGKEGNRLILALVCTSALTFGSWMLPGSRTMPEAIRPVDTLSPGTSSCKLVLCSHNALLLSFWRHPPNPGTFCKDKMVCLYHQEQVVQDDGSEIPWETNLLPSTVHKTCCHCRASWSSFSFLNYFTAAFLIKTH